MAGLDISSMNKFDGKNYSQWRFQINCALKAKGVYNVASGMKVKPGVTGDIEKWEKDDAIAMFTITAAMEARHITLIESCTTSCGMLAKLDSVFQQRSDFNKMLLLDKFHQLRMGTNETVVEYIARVENLSHQIKNTGESITDVTLITKILGTLPAKYRNFRQAWLSMDESRQNLSNLTARLIDEEANLNENEQEEMAFVANHRTPRSLVNQKPKVKQDKSKIVCYSCRKKGHFARECRSRTQKKSRDYNNEQGSRHSTDYNAFNAEFKETNSCRQEWILDSGASAHMTYDLHSLCDFEKLDENDKIRLGDNSELPIKGKGNIKVLKLVNNTWIEGLITNVLYVPGLKKNLFSEGTITNKDMKIIKTSDNAKIYNRDGTLVAMAVRTSNNLYQMLFKTIKPFEANTASTNSIKLWHERMGHINLKSLKELSDKGLIDNIDFSDVDKFFCEGCQYGKQHKLSFSHRKHKSNKPGELIYSDLCGPMSTSSLGGANYFVIFKDDFSGYVSVAFLKHKSDTLEHFKKFVSLCENKHSAYVKSLRVDNGREYINNDFKNFLHKKGIELEPTAPYTPQQNGRAERNMRTIMESARSMLHSKNLPLFLWAEAVNTAVYLLNHAPTSQSPGSTPYELWTGKELSLKHLRTFGSEAYMHVPDQLRKKLLPKSIKTIFVGYERNSTNYRLFDPESKTIKISRNVTFNENSHISEIHLQNTIPISNPEYEDTASELQTTSETSESDTFNESQNLDDNDSSYNLRPRQNLRIPRRYDVNVAEIPKTYEEAVNSQQSKEWKDAMKEELESLEKNNTWELVEYPQGKNVIGSKWVFNIKYLPNGKIERFKARLCAKGFSQVEGVDFYETFSPTSRYDTIRTILAIAAQKKLKILQSDIKTAFLHGDIDEEIYMQPPPGLPAESDLVCKLRKALYGLKQSSRCWNKKFSDFLLNYGFNQSMADPCLFHGVFQSKKVFLILYVDDILLLCEDEGTLNDIMKVINKNFEATICKSGSFVGMEIDQNKDGSIFIHSQAYIKKILRQFNLDSCNPVNVPADPNVILSSELDTTFEGTSVPYREAVGSLMFLSSTTRPDITYAVNLVSRFQNNFSQIHWNAVKRIMKYLKATPYHGIQYMSESENPYLVAYSDADFAGDLDTRKSTTGYVFMLSNGAITWCTSRQQSVSTSTTESEYIAASTAVKEVIWLRQLLCDIDELSFCAKNVTLHIDNQSAIKLIKNPLFHRRTKHIDVKYHFIREKYHDKTVDITYINSNEQLADIFTKALPRDRFEKLRTLISCFAKC